MNKRKVYSALALLGAALAACAPVKKDDAAAVEQRATERWNLLIAHQAEKAYDYLSPGYRLTIPRDKYAERMNDTAVRWKAVRVGSRTCEADTCTLTMLIDTLVPVPSVGTKPATLPTEEHWLRIDGRWYYVPDERMKAKPVGAAGAHSGEPADASKHKN